MNTVTAQKIKYIAECAHEDVALTTLKNAKDCITNRSKIFAGYENQWAGVDRAEVLEAFEQAMDCTRKADFTRRIELLIETMINIEIENERAAIRAAREAAAPAEEFEIIIKGSVGVDNPFHKGDVVYFGSILNMKATVTKLPKIGDVIRATGGVYNATEERVKVREILNDMPPRPAHLEAARNAHHDELFSGFFNDRTKPTPERERELEDMNDNEIYIAFAVEPAAPAAVAPTADDVAREAVRIANKSGYWITRPQIDAVTADGKDYTAEQIARIIINELKAADLRAQYAAELATAQAGYNAAAEASEAALICAVDASPDGSGDTPEFEAYYQSEVKLTEATTALLQACGRYSVEMATYTGVAVADIEALKTMFMPAFTNQIDSYHPGRRNELVSKALSIPASATQTH